MCTTSCSLIQMTKIDVDPRWLAFVVDQLKEKVIASLLSILLHLIFVGQSLWSEDNVIL